MSNRAEAQRLPKEVIVGSNVRRIPEGATARYIAWANSLTNEQLYLHQYRECTLLAPTWLLRRDWFEEVGRFHEPQPGSKYHLEEGKAPAVPDDLIFFNRHLDRGGKLFKTPHTLVVYRSVAHCLVAAVVAASTLFLRLRLCLCSVVCNGAQVSAIWQFLEDPEEPSAQRTHTSFGAQGGPMNSHTCVATGVLRTLLWLNVDE